MSFSNSKVRITMFRSVFVFLLSFFGSNTGSVASEGWVVPEKQLSAASGLSDETRQLLTALGASQFDMRNMTLDGDLRQGLLGIAEQAMLQQKDITIETHESQFGVKIQTFEMAGVKVYKISPPQIHTAFEGRIFMHAHGGAHFLGGGAMAAQEGAMIAASAGIEVISVDYTLSTEAPFPAALNDLVAVFQELLKTFPASDIAVGGTSAGGNLTLATVLKLKELKLKVPGALFVGTPNADLLFTGDSIITNEYIDNTLVTVEGMIRASAKVYAGEFELTNPLISPLYGDFSDFPPTYLVSGTRDLLLSDTVKVHRKLRDAGVETDLNIFEGVPHGAYLAVPGSKEFNGALGDLKTFLQRHL